MQDHANAELMRDPNVLWECAIELYFTRNGGATLVAEEAWHALSESERTVYAQEAIRIQREHSKSLAHLPAPSYQSRQEFGPLISG